MNENKCLCGNRIAELERELERHRYMVECRDKRIAELEDLLQSAHAIAERSGEGTHWKSFRERLKELQISSITPKTFHILPSDSE